MKTAISIPDEIFRAAEEFAAWRGLSRSELYAEAVRRYLEEARRDQLTQQVNEVCAQTDTSLEPDLQRASRRALRNVEW